MQKAIRKEVERAFGQLQSCWIIICDPTRFWDRNKLKNIMYAYIILHNMIVKYEGDAITNQNDDDEEPIIPMSQGYVKDFQNYLQRNAEIYDRKVYNQFRSDLVEYI